MSNRFTETGAGPEKDGDSEGGEERGVATKVRPKTKKPSMWRVILMNDDYTPMEFVVSILKCASIGYRDLRRLYL